MGPATRGRARENDDEGNGEGEDCDEYSQIWFYVLAYAHQLGVFLYDFPKYSEQYHLGSMIVWG